MMDEFKEGQYIIYKNGDRYEIGKIKRITSNGAFVYYSSGDTASKTPFDCMHKITNEYVIGEMNLGGCTTPVRHGNWILPDVCYEDIECSVCHAYMPLPISFDYRPTYKYCPMCGAKMDEVSE